MEEKPKKRLHIKLGFLVLAILLVYVLFKVNIQKVVNSPQFNENTSYIEKEAKILFNKYLQKPALYIWNNLFTDLLHASIKNFNQSDIDKVIKPDKINNYFGNTSEETVNQLSRPVDEN
jgi:hypothetical protein